MIKIKIPQIKMPQMPKWRKQENKISSSIVAIKIRKLLGNKIPIVVARFEAEQQKDESYNLTYVGDDGNFVEPVEISRELTIELLKYKLDLMSKTHDQKLEIINKAIKAQETRLKVLEQSKFIERVKKSKSEKTKDDKTNAEKEITVNKIDEINKLTHLKIVKDTVTNEGDGAFEEINDQGQRELTYNLMDGLLIPVFHNVTTHTTHPANDTKKKIHRDEFLLMLEEHQEESGAGSDKFKNTILFIGLVVLVLSGLAFVYYGFNLTIQQVNKLDSSEMAKFERAATLHQTDIKEHNDRYTNLLINYNSCLWNVTRTAESQNQENPNEYIEKVVGLS